MDTAVVASVGVVAVAANFTADPVRRTLEYWTERIALPLGVALAPYDQIFQQLLDPTSLLAGNTRGVNVVLVQLERWARPAEPRCPVVDARSLARNVDQLIDALSVAARRGTPHLVVLCPPSPAVMADARAAADIAAAEATITATFPADDAIEVVSAAELLAHYPVDTVHDADRDALGQIPYTDAFFAALGTFVARRARATRATPHKVVALDCDGTLWRGVLGEVGPHGVEIDEARRALQERIVQLHDAGMLVALCTKNNLADVEELFRVRHDMPLRWDHLVAVRANWEPKSRNLTTLAAELNLGLDAFVFVDDAPFEIAEVRAHCPDVLAVQLPDDADGIRRVVAHTWAFDRAAATAEDRKRTASYRVELQRERARQSAGTLEDFLRDLELTVAIDEPEPADYARAAQMTQRTNQFNTTTIRRTDAELRALIEDETLECRVVRVRDRYGDYGTVGLMLFASRGSTLRVDSFLLSCRALGRRVEHRMLAALGAIAAARGSRTVEIPLVETAKNVPARDFLRTIATATTTDDGVHCFRLTPAAACRAPDAPFVATATPRVEHDEPVRATPSARIAVALAEVAREPNDVASIVAAVNAAKPIVAPQADRTIVAPRDDTERAIADAWRHALHLAEVGVTENFFTLGGESLDAVAIFGRLRRRYGAWLSPTLLLQAPTIAELARIVAAGPTAKRLTSLVPLRAEGTHAPLFCVHAGAGTILFYEPFARALGADQPVYALQPVGLYGTDTPHTTIEQMATHYIAELRTVQPQGPYRLVGFCLGAIIAFEMAQQLRAAGDEVALLASLDGVAPGVSIESGRPPNTNRSVVQRALDRVVWHARRWRILALRRYRNRFGGPVPLVFRRFDWYFPVHHVLVKGRYRPTSYDGSMHVFTIAGRWPDRQLGWRKWVTGPLVVHEIVSDFANHRDLMAEPAVSQVAATIATLGTTPPTRVRVVPMERTVERQVVRDGDRGRGGPGPLRRSGGDRDQAPSR